MPEYYQTPLFPTLNFQCVYAAFLRARAVSSASAR